MNLSGTKSLGRGGACWPCLQRKGKRRNTYPQHWGETVWLWIVLNFRNCYYSEQLKNRTASSWCKSAFMLFIVLVTKVNIPTEVLCFEAFQKSIGWLQTLISRIDAQVIVATVTFATVNYLLTNRSAAQVTPFVSSADRQELACQHARQPAALPVEAAVAMQQNCLRKWLYKWQALRKCSYMRLLIYLWRYIDEWHLGTKKHQTRVERGWWRRFFVIQIPTAFRTFLFYRNTFIYHQQLSFRRSEVFFCHRV